MFTSKYVYRILLWSFVLVLRDSITIIHSRNYLQNISRTLEWKNFDLKNFIKFCDVRDIEIRKPKKYFRFLKPRLFASSAFQNHPFREMHTEWLRSFLASVIFTLRWFCSLTLLIVLLECVRIVTSDNWDHKSLSRYWTSLNYIRLYDRPSHRLNEKGFSRSHCSTTNWKSIQVRCSGGRCCLAFPWTLM